MMDNSSILIGTQAWSDHATIIGVFYVTFTTLMLIPYLLCIRMLIQEVKSASCKAFYTIAVHLGSADIFQLVLNGFYCSMRCLLHTWSPSTIMETVIIVPLSGCWFTCTTLAQLMAINRFVNVYFMVMIDVIFSVERVRIMLVLCWLYGMAHSLIRATPYVHLYYDSNVYAILYDQRQGFRLALNVNGILNLAHCVLLLGWYLLIYGKLLLNKRKLQASSIQSNKNAHSEHRVLVHSVVICLSNLTICIVWIFLQVFLRGYDGVLFIGNLVWIFCAGNNALIQLLLNSTIRQRLFDMLCRENRIEPH